MFAVSPAGPDYRNGCKACNSFDVAPCSRDSIGGRPIEALAGTVRPDGRLLHMTRHSGPLVGGTSHGVWDLGRCDVDVRKNGHTLVGQRVTSSQKLLQGRFYSPYQSFAYLWQLWRLVAFDTASAASATDSPQ